MSDYGMQEVDDGNGVVIWHEKGDPHVVTARYDTARRALILLIDGLAVRLTDRETAFFLAHTAMWHENNRPNYPLDDERAYPGS